jgi:hypothetical protein
MLLSCHACRCCLCCPGSNALHSEVSGLLALLLAVLLFLAALCCCLLSGSTCISTCLQHAINGSQLQVLQLDGIAQQFAYSWVAAVR